MPRSFEASSAIKPHLRENPPIRSAATIEPRFVIGRDSSGCWTVTDRDDHVGGTFVSEAAAYSFARQEANNDCSQISRLPDEIIIEFSMH